MTHTDGRTPLGEWSPRRRDIYMTKHNTQQETYIHTPGRNRTHNPSKRAVEDPRLTPAAFSSVCCFWRNSSLPPQWAMVSSFTKFLDHTQRRTTLGRTPLDKGSAPRRDLWEQTATCATYSINWLVFITQMKSVYSAVRTGALNKAVCASSVKGYYTYLCVLYLSGKNSDLCHLQHKLIGFYNRDEKCLQRGTDWGFI